MRFLCNCGLAIICALVVFITWTHGWHLPEVQVSPWVCTEEKEHLVVVRHGKRSYTTEMQKYCTNYKLIGGEQ